MLSDGIVGRTGGVAGACSTSAPDISLLLCQHVIRKTFIDFSVRLIRTRFRLGLVAYLIRKRTRRLCPEQHGEPLAKDDSVAALHELQDQSPVFHEVEDKDRLPVEIGSQNPIHELEARC